MSSSPPRHKNFADRVQCWNAGMKWNELLKPSHLSCQRGKRREEKRREEKRREEKRREEKRTGREESCKLMANLLAEYVALHHILSDPSIFSSHLITSERDTGRFILHREQKRRREMLETFLFGRESIFQCYCRLLWLPPTYIASLRSSFFLTLHTWIEPNSNWLHQAAYRVS